MIIQAFEQNQITLNEARSRLGLPMDNVWGHLYHDQLFQKIESLPFMQKSLSASEEQVLESMLTVQQTYAEVFRQALTTFYEEVRDYWFLLQEHQKSLFTEKDTDWHLNAIKQDLSELYQEHLRDAVKASARETANHYGMTVDDTEMCYLLFQRAQSLADQHINKLKKDLLSITDDDPDIRREKTHQLFEKYRTSVADRMAKTETVRMTHMAAKEVFRQNGVKFLKWSAEGHSCVFCRSLDNKVIPLADDSYFAKLGDTLDVEVDGQIRSMHITYEHIEYPPLHPHCHCRLLPVGVSPVQAVEEESNPVFRREIRVDDLKEHEMEKSERRYKGHFLNDETYEETKDRVAREITARLSPEERVKVEALGHVLEEEGWFHPIVPSREFYQNYDNVVDKASAFVVRQWAISSGKGEWSVAIQRAAQKEFGTDFAKMDHFNQIDEEKARQYLHVEEGLRILLRKQYENTQEWFKQQGIQDVILYRGMKTKHPLSGATYDTEPELAEVHLQPLNAFSTSSNLAWSFATLQDAFDPFPYAQVVGARIPVERIFSTALTGSGCRPEYEMIVLGPEKKKDLFASVFFRVNEDEEATLESWDVIPKLAQASEKAKRLRNEANMASTRDDKAGNDLPIPLSPTGNTTLRSLIEKRIQQGISTLQDHLEIGDMIYQEKLKRMKETMVEIQFPQKRKISLLELEQELEPVKKRIDELKKLNKKPTMADQLFAAQDSVYYRTRAQLHQQLLAEIGEVGFPDGKRPHVVVPTLDGTPLHEIIELKSKYAEADPEELKQILEKVQWFLPRHWLERATKEVIGYAHKANGRAGYNHKDRGMNAPVLGVWGNSATKGEDVLHEYGHHLQDLFPEIDKWSLEYLKYRAGENAKIERLKAIADRNQEEDGATYAPQEVGYDAKLPRAYMSRVYENGTTELLTTGLQALFGLSAKAKKYDLRHDSETEKFLWALLSLIGR